MAGLRTLAKGFGMVAAAFAACVQPAAASDNPAAPAGQAQRAPRPAIWLIEDSDTKIYLFGTVHVFPESLDWRSARLNEVIAEADELVMETPDASNAEMLAGERLFEPMMMGKTVSILSRVSPAARPALQAALEETGLPVEAYDEMHIWAVAFLLASHALTQGYSEEAGAPVRLSGAEEVLGQIFRKSRRPIFGVETIEEQIGVFATMPIDAQRRFLEATVMGSEAPGDAEAAPMADEAWVRGDVESIAADMGTIAPELYEPLLTRRNRNWTGWLQRRMERPGTVLFAVGAGHLAGPDSVQRMLEAEGITARRID